MAVVDPAIQAGINKAKANGGKVVDTGGNNFAALIAGAAGQQQQADATTIPLWRATHKATARHIGPDGEEKFRSQSVNTTPDQYGADDASTQFGILLMDKAKMHEWGQLARTAPGLGITADNINDATALGRAWDIAIGWAVNIKKASNGNTEVTPFEAAKMVAQNMGGALLAQQADAAAHYTGNRTSTSSTINQAQNAQTGDVLHQLLGRNPTAGEQATYQHGLNSVAAANPTKTTSVDTFANGVQTGQVNTVTGGYDEKAAAIQQASSASPDVAKNQQATVFYDALVNAIGAAV